MNAVRPRALLLDAAGTLLQPAVPVARSYAATCRRFGHDVDEALVRSRLRDAMRSARPLRRGDKTWRAFWAAVIERSTGCADARVLDALYEEFADAQAWTVAPGAETCVRGLHPMPTAVVSNWDLRLRPLLAQLRVDEWVDVIVVSAEEDVEKPDPKIFELACERLGVPIGAALHVGDNQKNDVQGARAAGCQALHFGTDVRSFDELAERLP